MDRLPGAPRTGSSATTNCANRLIRNLISAFSTSGGDTSISGCGGSSTVVDVLGYGCDAACPSRTTNGPGNLGTGKPPPCQIGNGPILAPSNSPYPPLPPTHHPPLLSTPP